MAIVAQVCLGVQVRNQRWSSSRDEWALVLNSRGVDVLNETVNYFDRASGVFTLYSNPRRFPPEAFARVYSFGAPVPKTPLFSDQVGANFEVDTAQLNLSSARFAIHGDDLIRPLHMVMWGLDAAMAVVPITLDVDMTVDVSEDPSEGPGSIPLTLVDSGDDATTFSEVILYVALDKDLNAATHQPVSFRIENADGAILFESELENFGELQRDPRVSDSPTDAEDARNAKIWRLTETAPALSRVDNQGRDVILKLRVTGPDNAMIQAVVAFGVNRSGKRPIIIPLVHRLPSFAGGDAWLGTHDDPGGRDMVLPLCATASRQ